MHFQEQEPIFNAFSLIIFGVIACISLVSIASFLIPQFFLFVYEYCVLRPQELSLTNSYTLISYGFLHSDFNHLGMNMLWLLIFGTPIVRFFGTRSFMIIFLMGLITGGAVFLTYPNNSEVIGASAGVSACAGAALRFMLKPAFDFNNRPQLYKLSDGRFLLPSVIFFVIDIISALFMNSNDQSIAWQSHIIGYMTGAILMEFYGINHGALKRNKLTPTESEYMGD